jgi:SAM-dependent methyltransferase
MPPPAAVRQPDQRGVGWFATPLAQRLMRAEQRQVSPLLAGCYGQVGVYLRGSPSAPPELSGNMLQTVLKLHRERDGMAGDLVCRDDELPLQRESVDLVYLLHAIETLRRPALLLAEAERVLTPEGALLMVVLNPFSLWRARWSNSGLFAVSAPECRSLLNDAGFEIMQQRGLASVMPWLDDETQDGSKGSPDPVGALRAGYVMLARKRRAGITPLRARNASVPLNAEMRAG